MGAADGGARGRGAMRLVRSEHSSSTGGTDVSIAEGAELGRRGGESIEMTLGRALASQAA